MRIILWMMLLMPVVVHAQSDCLVQLVDAEKGVYRVQCDDEEYILVSGEKYEEAAEEVERQKSEIAQLSEQLLKYKTQLDEYDNLRIEYAELTGRYNKLSADLINLTVEYKTASTDLVSLNDEYKVLVKDYDELAGEYRDIALHSSSNFKFRAGVGVNNSKLEKKWDVLIGTELFGIHGWIYGNTDRQGIAVGITF